ncbi:histidine kinase [Streptomyces sp. NPDC006990]|uniref:sensor histidine kinase n=1 Tax=Streptomyces sp. NPDC006990 TaxID=3154481 RepID=UPI003455767F
MTTSRAVPGGWRSFAVGAAGVCLVPPALLGPSGALLVSVSALLVVVVPLLRWPWGRVPPSAAAFAAMAVSLLTDVLYAGRPGLTLLWMPFECVGLLILTGCLVRHTRSRYLLPAGLLAVLTTLALPLRFTLRKPGAGADDVVIMVLVTLLPVACAVGIGSYLRFADNRRRRAVLQARREQRLQMARVLHDSVAHEVTGMVLDVQAAQVAPQDPGESRALLSRVEEAGLRALDSMDRALQTLRRAEEVREGAGGQEPAHPSTRVYGVADLPELVGRFAESGSGTVELDLDEGLAGALPREVDEAVYVLVLEALTNVRRHAAGARRVTVAVEPASGAVVRVRVVNEGGGSTRPLLPSRKGGGAGLVGLEERYRSLGGVLESGPCAGGWRVAGTLPTAAPTASSGSR